MQIIVKSEKLKFEFRELQFTQKQNQEIKKQRNEKQGNAEQWWMRNSLHGKYR